jgi:3-methylfumaryl-CoA hydratase
MQDKPLTLPEQAAREKSVTRRLVFSEETATRIALMLGVEQQTWPGGSSLPVGWHFPLIGAQTPRAALRSDGFPGLGIAFPPAHGRRLVAAGRKVEVSAPISIGAELERTSRISLEETKESAHGNLTIISVEHVLRNALDQSRLVNEQQSYIVTDALYTPPAKPSSSVISVPIIKTITPDETMLFQFSALSFNSHKIHLDRDYAKNVEFYPDLVVNGGLTTLLLTEIVRSQNQGRIRHLAVRNKAPLFCNRQIHFGFSESESSRKILAYDDQGQLAAEMEYATDEL